MESANPPISSSYELSPMAAEGQDETTYNNDAVQSAHSDVLPPADSGYQAWLALAGCFVINVLIWGSFAESKRMKRKSGVH